MGVGEREQVRGAVGGAATASFYWVGVEGSWILLVESEIHLSI